MSSALILFSGGQDSTVCLGWALERYDRVETIGFDYGQRHHVELECRKRLLAELSGFRADRLGRDHVLSVPVMGELADSALTGGGRIEMGVNGLPSSFVPGRNLIFFSLAGALAYGRDLERLVGGMSEADYSGYPDCRAATLEAMSLALSRGLDRSVPIEAPLMGVDKAGTWEMAQRLGGAEFVELICEHSHSCYLGDRSVRHEWGYGCGACPACLLRRHGWEKWRFCGANS